MDEQLQALTGDRERERHFSFPVAKKIALRLQQMVAARSLEDMKALPGRCQELSGDPGGGYLAVGLVPPYRLIFRPTEGRAAKSPTGGLNWTAVDSVTVTSIAPTTEGCGP